MTKYKIGYKENGVWKYVEIEGYYSELARTMYHYLLLGDGKVSIQRIEPFTMKE